MSDVTLRKVTAGLAFENAEVNLLLKDLKHCYSSLQCISVKANKWDFHRYNFEYSEIIQFYKLSGILTCLIFSNYNLFYRYYCDYCDTYLTHDSPSVRKTHCSGRKHKENVRFYYQKWMEEQAQSLIDATTAAFKAGKISTNPFAPGPNRPPGGAMIPPPPTLQGPVGPRGIPPPTVGRMPGPMPTMPPGPMPPMMAPPGPVPPNMMMGKYSI
ncbi:U1 small nuclear ribonucleoprotein C [Nymphon striatum]|nr:U1 small nuclear ribonucleoprotein C [Nymphon striatum]